LPRLGGGLRASVLGELEAGAELVLEGLELVGEREIVRHAVERDVLECDAVLDSEIVDALHVRLGAPPRAEGALAIVGGERDAIRLERFDEIFQLLEELPRLLRREQLVAYLVVHGPILVECPGSAGRRGVWCVLWARVRQGGRAGRGKNEGSI